MFSLRPVGARARYIPIVSLVLGKAPQSSLTFSATRLYYDATRPIHGYPTMATDNEHKDGGSTTPSRRSRGGKGQQRRQRAAEQREGQNQKTDTFHLSAAGHRIVDPTIIRVISSFSIRDYTSPRRQHHGQE